VDRDVRRQIVTIVAYIATVIVNAAAVAIPLGGLTTAQISDRFPVLIVPANYVFSIWSVIYLLLLAFTIFQALPAQRADATLRRLGYLPALTGVLNAVWVLLWQYQVFALTVPVMLALLVTLITIYLRVREPGAEPSLARGWIVLTPFSVYLGWITVATIANVTQMGYYAGFRGAVLPPGLWAVGILLAGLAIAAVVITRARDIAYGAVIVWAYAGIAVKQRDVTEVAVVAAVGAAAIALLIVATALEPRLSGRRQAPRGT
jgi:benzodiazapine receptor